MKFYPGRFIFLLLALFCCSHTFAQMPYNRLFGTYATEMGKAGFIRADSSIYAVGTSSAFMDQSSQVYLIRVDKNGDLVWSNFYGDAGVDDATDVYYQTDTAIYIVANSYQGPGKGYDIKIIKTDVDGNLAWEKSFGTSDWDIPAQVIRISAHAYAVCGYTYGNSVGLADGMIFAFSDNGDSLWFKNFGTVNDEMLYDIVQADADTLVACGETVLPSGKKQGWLARFSIGAQNLVDSHDYGTAYSYTFNGMELTPGGQYLMAVTTDSTAGTHTDMYIWNIDHTTYNISQQIVIGGPNDEQAIDVKVFNSEWMILGNTNSYGLGGFDPAVYRFDSTGAWFVNAYTFGTSEDNYGNDFFLNNNGTFTIVGSSPKSFGPRDLWIINLDSAFEVYDVPDAEFDVNEVHEIQHANDFVLYPNPASEGFYVKANDPLSTVVLTDGLGRKVMTRTGQNPYVSTAGMYCVELYFGNGVRSTKKLVIR
jgi:hypothetical protein